MRDRSRAAVLNVRTLRQPQKAVSAFWSHIHEGTADRAELAARSSTVALQDLLLHLQLHVYNPTGRARAQAAEAQAVSVTRREKRVS